MTKIINISEAGDYVGTDERGRKVPRKLYAYSPTDCPQNTYTSPDMALTVAGYEHGRVKSRADADAEARRDADEQNRKRWRNRSEDDAGEDMGDDRRSGEGKRQTARYSDLRARSRGEVA